MTPTELIILGRNDIRSDKFGAAAISYVYKAFGNLLASKEIWPFSEKNNMKWQEPKSFEEDCNIAIKFIEKAIDAYYNELEDNVETKDTVSYGSSNITKLNNVLKNVKRSVNIIDETSEAIIRYSNDTENNIEDIEKS